MKDYRPEVVAWRWFKPIVNDHGETVGGAWKLGEAPGFLPWWPNEPLVRLTDYEALKVKCRILESELATVKMVAYGNVDLLDEREKLLVECEKLVEALEAMLAVNVVEADVSYGTACAKAEQVLDDHRKEGDQCTTNA